MSPGRASAWQPPACRTPRSPGATVEGSLASEVTVDGPATGIRILQRRVFEPRLGCLRVSSELENTGPAAARVARVHLADWSFRVAADADAMRYRELSHRNEPWYGSTFWSRTRVTGYRDSASRRRRRRRGTTSRPGWSRSSPGRRRAGARQFARHAKAAEPGNSALENAIFPLAKPMPARTPFAGSRSPPAQPRRTRNCRETRVAQSESCQGHNES